MEIILAPIKDAARALGVCENTVYALARKGKIEAVKVGRRTMVRAESLRAYAAQLEAAPLAEAA